MGDHAEATTFARAPWRLLACGVGSPRRSNPGSPKLTMSHDVVAIFALLGVFIGKYLTIGNIITSI